MKLSQLGTQLKVLNHYRGGCSTCARKLIEHVPATIRDTEIILVGEAPGRTEVAEGEGFVGRSGMVLRQKLEQWSGITSDQYSLTNVVKCRPFSKNNPTANRAPSVKDISCCMAQYTIEEIRDYPYVVLVGSKAMTAFFPGQQAKNLRGNLTYHPDYPGQRFYGMHHPAWAMRRFGASVHKQTDADMIGNYEYDFWRGTFERLGRLIRGEEIMAGYGDWEVLDLDSRSFMAKLDYAMKFPCWSFDVETTNGFSWQDGSRITDFALTWDGRHVLAAGEDDPHFQDAITAMVPWFEARANIAIGHHIGYDLQWIETVRRFSVQCKMHDTGILYNRAHGFEMPSLKLLVAEKRDGYRHMIHKPQDWTDPRTMRLYNAEDVIHPWHLVPQGKKRLQERTKEYLTPSDRRDPWELYCQVGGPSDLFLTRAGANGMLFNFEAWEQTKTEFLKERRRHIEEWAEEDRHYRYWFRSGDNEPEGIESKASLFKEYLYDRRKWPVIKETDSGARSTDKDVIARLIQDYSDQGTAVLRHQQEIARIDKLLDTYISGYPDKNVEPDGRVHSSFVNTKTDTGRNISFGPNVQNIPRDSRIRRFFMAPDGYVIMESDFSQIELRVMFSLSHDSAAIKFYNEGRDAHALTAMAITGRSDYTKDERTKAKAVNFSLMYGGDYWTLQRYARTAYKQVYTDEEARAYTTAFFNQYATLKPYHQRIITELIRNRGVLQTVMGHIHTYHAYMRNHEARGLNPEARQQAEHIERAAINSHGQGTAAYMANALGILTQHAISQRRLYPHIATLNTVHDSIMLQVREDLIDTAIECMEEARVQVEEWCRYGKLPKYWTGVGHQPAWFKVPLILEHSAGPTWGDLKEIA